MIWCCGMYSSGSTWTYNATRAAGAAAATQVKQKGCYADDYKTLAALVEPGVTYVVKTHDMDDKCTALLAARSKKIILTIRDPRDAVVSLMQHMRQPFGNALDLVDRSARQTRLFAQDPRAMLLRYESGFIDDPRTFDLLAGVFGGTLTDAARKKLFAESRRAAIEAKIARLEDLPTMYKDARTGDVVDTDSHWHRHHANRTGETGAWRRMLPAAAIAVIEARTRDWMRENFYELEH